MLEVQSDKKNFAKNATPCKSANCVTLYFRPYENLFQVARHNRSGVAMQYIQGLLRLDKGKANMERMEEEIPESEYRAYQHFITNSKWDYRAVINKVCRDASEVIKSVKSKSGRLTGLIIDESAHLKRGDKSVGVARQYAGVVGKVENCQVGVYASLVNDNRAVLVNERLYLPRAWSGDRQRCRQAGIPPREVNYKTKPELALEMIDEIIGLGAEFDWVGGDGLYGHNGSLRCGLDRRGLLFILDIHKDETVYLEKPVFSIPDKQGKRGRPAKRPTADRPPVKLKDYINQLGPNDWKEERKVRRTQKGWKKSKVHLKRVWVCEGADGEVKERTLIITQNVGGPEKTKYSLSNGKIQDYTHREYAWMQSQRYWVERTFDDSKNELGMSDYQVRKWTGWHHHHSLVLMAGLFLLVQKIENETEAPLMSTRDARILAVIALFGTEKDLEIRMKQMKKRHRKRQADIDRRYNNLTS